jgi:hypothetical protein
VGMWLFGNELAQSILRRAIQQKRNEARGRHHDRKAMGIVSAAPKWQQRGTLKE